MENLPVITCTAYKGLCFASWIVPFVSCSSLLGDNFALLTGLLEGLSHLGFELGVVGGAHANLVGVGGSTAERTDLGARDAGRGESTAQILFVLAIILVLHRVDLATGEVDAEVEALHGDEGDACHYENHGNEAEAATVRNDLEVRFVDSLEAATNGEGRSVTLGELPIEDGAGKRNGTEERGTTRWKCW